MLPIVVHTQVAIQESWGQRQANAEFDKIWAGAGSEWADVQCTRCRAWEMQVGAACEPAMWLDASACFDDSQAAADAARRAAEQSAVRSCTIVLLSFITAPGSRSS